MKAAIIVIGNEVLSGETLDTNSQFLGQQLLNIGIAVIKKITIPDLNEIIKQSLDDCFQVADVVICSGGLGPTNDDVTKIALSEYFNSPLRFNEAVFENITQLLRHRYKNISEVHRLQAYIPDIAKVLSNKMGTASGLLFTENNKILIALPGVPYELKHITETQLLPYLLTKKNKSSIIQRNIKTIGIGESVIAEIIKDIEDHLPKGISLAYLPSIGQVKLRLTAFTEISQEAEKDIEEVIDKIKNSLSDYIYGYEDDNISAIIGNMLRKDKKTLALAESCTGGYLSHLITSEAGSSDYYKGGIIAYSNEIKIAKLGVPENIINSFGAVSHQCAEAMATGIRNKFGTSYGLATTGIAGPTGGSADKPLGLVWIALADEAGTISNKIIFDRGRLQNIQFSTITALNMLRKRIQGIKSH